MFVNTGKEKMMSKYREVQEPIQQTYKNRFGSRKTYKIKFHCPKCLKIVVKNKDCSQCVKAIDWSKDE